MKKILGLVMVLVLAFAFSTHAEIKAENAATYKKSQRAKYLEEAKILLTKAKKQKEGFLVDLFAGMELLTKADAEPEQVGFNGNEIAHLFYDGFIKEAKKNYKLSIRNRKNASKEEKMADEYVEAAAEMLAIMKENEGGDRAISFDPGAKR